MWVTGLGAVSALGWGVRSLWEGLRVGRDGLAPIARFPTRDFGVRIAGLVPEHNHPLGPETRYVDLVVAFAVSAAREAWCDAGLADTPPRPERVALVMGTSAIDHAVPVHELTERVGAALDIRGPCITISTACTSSTNALGMATDLLCADVADVVIAGGADALTPTMFAGFHALGVLSTEKCAPFSYPFGTTLGEGAGFLVLEKPERVRDRGARARAAVTGYGLSADAFHETGPDPTGSGVARAIRSALAQAELEADVIGYVNAHGTGTIANDPAEWRALRAVFGARAAALPVSSTKSVVGHAQAAAGALESLATMLGMAHGVLPQTLHFRGLRPNCPPDPVGQDTPRPGTYQHAICTNSAFAGANAALVLSEPTTATRAWRRRDVFIAGLGAVGPDGTLGAPDHQPELERLVQNLDPSGLDPSSAYLLAAVAQALAEAGLGRPRASARDRVGLVLGVTNVSEASARALDRSIDQRGLAFLSATAFSRMVLNAPAGTCGKLLSLRGPTSTLSTGSGSGLVAMAYAASLLESRDDVDGVIAAGLDELGPGDGSGASGGCACALLSALPAAGPGPRVRVAGWSVAGPAQRERVVSHALERAGLARHELGLVHDASGPPAGGAAGPARALVAACRQLERELGRSALIVSAAGQSASSAIVLVNSDGPA
jgi:3-oxoacyl-[acyl-carrier-protein] synthase II